MTAPPLGKIGIWSMELRSISDPGAAADAAAELDELGYGALWIPGGIEGHVLGTVDHLLGATTRISIATGIINIWKQTPEEVAAWFEAGTPERQSRTMLGLGVSHMPLVGEDWAKTRPLTQMRTYLDGLDAAGVPRENLSLAALGPKMVALSGERTAGAHPYLVPPEHSAIARAILGPGKLLAPEQGVVLATDPDVARGAAREAVDRYRSLPNYRDSWKRMGLLEEDIEAMSDRFIDALFAWGTPEKIAERVKAHYDAGADHVCLQVIPTSADGGLDAARAAWRELAEALI